MAIRVGRWDCPVCKTKGNLGPDKQCINCGSARPQDVKFYLSDDAEIVKNIEKLKAAKAGADWICSYCNSHNKVSEKNCHTCGNDRQVEEGDESLKQSVNYTDGRKQTSEKQTSEKEKKEKREKLLKEIGKIKTKKSKKGCFISIIIFVLFVLFAILRSDVKVVATDFEWERSISIEKYENVIEHDWSVPSGGTKIESYEAVHHYDQIPDGTETKTRTVSEQTGSESVKVGERDLGNGYFEDVYEEKPTYSSYEETYEETVYKDVPVYETKYKYSIFKWIDAGDLKTKGENHKPYWSKDKKFENIKHREKEKKESYFIFIKEEDGDKHKEEVSFEYWQEINLGDTLLGEISTIYRNFRGLKEGKKKETEK